MGVVWLFALGVCAWWLADRFAWGVQAYSPLAGGILAGALQRSSARDGYREEMLRQIVRATHPSELSPRHEFLPTACLRVGLVPCLPNA